MFYGKSRPFVFMGEVLFYATRKDRKKPSTRWSRPFGPGKKNKVQYHRQMRNGKLKLYDFKNSNWKKAPCADKWNWD